jgi:hypothetical protein
MTLAFTSGSVALPPVRLIGLIGAVVSITHETTAGFRLTRRITPATTTKIKTATPHQRIIDAMLA